jgi:hypothetical protein
MNGGLARRKVGTYTGQHLEYKHIQTFMHRVGFETTTPTIRAGETVHALKLGAIVIGFSMMAIKPEIV